jgi:arginyl-tRNA synthetase
VYHLVEARFRTALSAFIRRKYGLEIAVPAERPPRIELGEIATPVSFELAKPLKRAPRQIAQEIASEIGPIEGIARLDLAGAGYLNAFLDRGAFFASVVSTAGRGAAPVDPRGPKTIVEHTNINPNKAAHIGHLRNAVLGDTLVRLLLHSGQRVEVQNYIDNTGVQVADVVVAFLHLDKKTPEEVRDLAAKPQFDYYCWDLYARVTHFFAEDPARASLRGDTLKAIEEDRGEVAEVARIISNAIVRCHLRTMERLGVEYDLLPRESEILHLKFWEAAFEQLKQRGAIELATSGKSAGCWVMKTPGTSAAESDEGNDPYADAKIIVRSNGTVTYVGKDIAYQLWKFGLLGRDFHYRRYLKYPDSRELWETTAERGDPSAPPFGKASRVYNVIDTRQSYLQDVVVLGLRALGFNKQADESIHFNYEIVALTPRCANELGYELAADEVQKNYVEVSGRKGLGVKADDLLDRLEAATLEEVVQRHPEMSEPEQISTAHAIAIGALRYFMLRFARNTIIAFDFKDALSFEGETGPYCQYAVVRAKNIIRKWVEQGDIESEEKAFEEMTSNLASEAAYFQRSWTQERYAELESFTTANDIWELTLIAGSLGGSVAGALAAQEPAFVAKYAFQLAQAFNNFYHKHHILSEENAAKKRFMLVLTIAVQAQLTAALALLGIDAPEKM